MVTLRAAATSRGVTSSRAVMRLAGQATVRAFLNFLQSNNLTYAASIAYYALLSLFPFLLFVLSILGRMAIGKAGSAERVLQMLIGTALPSRFEFLATQLQDLASTRLRLTVFGTILVVWGAMGVFGAITAAVNHAWGVERQYGFFKNKLIAFVMLLAAALLAVAALLVVTAAQLVEAHWFAALLLRFPEVGELRSVAYNLAPTPVFILVVGLVYYYVPNAQVRLRDVWFGAVVAGLLWRGAFAGFAWYLRDQSRFSIDGSLSTVVAFLVWVYLSAVILLYGVEVTAAYARLRKHLPEDGPAAPARRR